MSKKEKKDALSALQDIFPLGEGQKYAKRRLFSITKTTESDENGNYIRHYKWLVAVNYTIEEITYLMCKALDQDWIDGLMVTSDPSSNVVDQLSWALFGESDHIDQGWL